MEGPTLHAFLRRLERDRVLRLDLRVTLALEELLAARAEDAARGAHWSAGETAAAIASVLATDAEQWRTLHERISALATTPGAPHDPPGRDPPPFATPRDPPPPPAAPRPRSHRWAAAALVAAALALVRLALLGEDAALDPAPQPPSAEPEVRTSPPLPEPDELSEGEAPAAPVDAGELAPDPAASEAPPSVLDQPDSAVALGWILTLLSAALGIILLRARRLQRDALVRDETQILALRRLRAEEDDSNALLYGVEDHAPLPLTAIDDAAATLGAAVAVGHSPRLDIRATLDSTVRAAGRFSPVTAPAQVQRELTVLIDVESGGHPFLPGLLHVLRRWARLGVSLARYDFAYRPRRVTPQAVDADPERLRRGDRPRILLDELARSREGAPLLIATRMTRLGERRGAVPWLRHLPEWSAKVLLDLDPRPLAERDAETRRIAARLEGAGVRRFPFTAEGLRAAVMYLMGHAGLSPADDRLPAWQDLLPALRRWSALAACVPDPTWLQLDAFRRSFPELHRELPDPRLLQRLLDWLRSEGVSPISADGRRLALPEELALTLLEELRLAEGLPPGQLSSLERRARELIMSQLEAVEPTSRAMAERRSVRLAFHRALLEPRQIGALRQFLVGADAPELGRMLAAHLRRVPEAARSAWRCVSELADAKPDGPIPLRWFVYPAPWTRHELALLIWIAGSSFLGWTLSLYFPREEPSPLAWLTLVGLSGIGILGLNHLLKPPAPPPPPELDHAPTGSVLGSGPMALLTAAPMSFVGLSGGEFTMGSDRDPREGPRHRVTVGPFLIAITPITEAQWHAVMGETPRLGAEALPRIDLSWRDAIEYLNRLSVQERLSPCYEISPEGVRWLPDRDGYRLPTEAEWEFAARAGTTSDYSFGDDPALLDVHGWHRDNCDAVQPVGRKHPNPWGLHDVHGNVWEWVWDAYGPYAAQPTHDPCGPDGHGPAPLDHTPRVLRGGTYLRGPKILRSAIRFHHPPHVTAGVFGLRPARSLWGHKPQADETSRLRIRRRYPAVPPRSALTGRAI